MKTTYFLTLGVICAMIVSCKNKKQTLSDNPEETAKLEELYDTEQTLDTIIPNPGIKYTESRETTAGNQLVTIDLESVGENKMLDLSQYYSHIEYVTITHPLAEQGIAFFGNTKYTIFFERGSTMGDGLNSSVFLSENNIVAGDNSFGYHCFNMQGEYIYTIASKKELPEFNLKSNTLTIQVNNNPELIQGFSMLEDNCLITKLEHKKYTFNFHNVSTKKNYLTRPASNGSSSLLSPEAYISYLYNPRNPNREAIMYSFNIEGDTLCKFMNYNSLFNEEKGVYTNPESSDFYRFNNQLTMHQAYNDTIFRVNEKSLTPVFILNKGDKKPDVQTALKGDKQGKIFINTLLETKDFFLIAYSENYDCPNTRKSGAVKFFYTYYDKKENKKYTIPATSFPEFFILHNGIPEGIPLLVNNAKIYKDKLYVSYTKRQLNEIAESEGFKSFSKNEQEKLKSLRDSLSDFELLIMILQ